MLAAVCYGREVHPKRWHPVSDQMIQFINALNTTWKAGRNFHKSTTMSYVRGLMGVHPRRREHILEENVHEEIPDVLPESFDACEKWPHCSSIRVIHDQSACSGCWAVAVVSVISDRICIHSEGKVQVNISAEDLLGCCRTCGDGCNGGSTALAWQYWKQSGLVSGGLYGSRDGCRPFSLPPCEHHTKGPLPNCSEKDETATCEHASREGYEKKYYDDKHFGKEVYSIPNDEKQIQMEIFKNGPVQADYVVYGDFPSYKSGVYQHRSGDARSLHAIRILGWGVENGTPYWLAANSWNPNWGDQGYFKILRGQKECGIKDHVYAGIPKFKKA